eukprot:TRINITY_DN8226_c0_g1_i4.p1 TRINITY_DN8226_c0_g1~~TRINITY_DN8226_c0_g1_i4.p1  ORF type:complete len:196 (-),score=69.11 TRINITY_DN8226_c0_g1_i4:60-587(-)
MCIRDRNLIATLREEIITLKILLGERDSKITQLEAFKIQLEDRIRTLEKELEQLRNLLKEKDQDIDRLTVEGLKLREENASKDKRIGDLEGDNEHLKQQLDEANRTLQEQKTSAEANLVHHTTLHTEELRKVVDELQGKEKDNQDIKSKLLDIERKNNAAIEDLNIRLTLSLIHI